MLLLPPLGALPDPSLSPHFRSLSPLSLDQYTEEQKQELVDCCPKEVFDRDEYTGAVRIARQQDCIFCRECIYTLEDFRRAPEDALAVDVIHNPDKFTFTVETTGALTAQQVVSDGIAVLKAKLNMINKLAQELVV